MIEEINDSDFEQKVLKSDKPVIVDFWASWCMPCVMMAPIFEEVSEEYKGKLKFAKVNVERNRMYASEFDITGIPCLVVIKNGKEIGRIVGLQNEESLKQRINSILR